ncbi:MAG: SRPBCC family protein, partial [Thermoleophilaceae bacterium]
MSEPWSVVCVGEFEIPVSSRRVRDLFTPEGERSWVAGWDPRYPDPNTDRRVAGTVFVTDAHGAESVWVITAVAEAAISYARFDDHGIMGTVEVRWSPTGDRRSRVEVAYRSTALRESARGRLAQFANDYDAFLASWRDAI